MFFSDSINANLNWLPRSFVALYWRIRILIANLIHWKLSFEENICMQWNSFLLINLILMPLVVILRSDTCLRPLRPSLTASGAPNNFEFPKKPRSFHEFWGWKSFVDFFLWAHKYWISWILRVQHIYKIFIIYKFSNEILIIYPYHPEA